MTSATQVLVAPDEGGSLTQILIWSNQTNLDHKQLDRINNLLIESRDLAEWAHWPQMTNGGDTGTNKSNQKGPTIRLM